MQAPTLEGPSSSHLDHKLNLKKPARWATGAFLAALAGGMIYAGSQLISDLQHVHSPSIFPFVILGIAGTMAANRSGLQWATVRNMLMAWVLTLPISIALSALLFWAFSHF